MQRNIIIEKINNLMGQDLLEVAMQKDEMANGVQILGAEDVNKIAFGVSCNQYFLEEAIEWGAQMCVFHHGLDTSTHKSQFPMYLQKRLGKIFKHDLTILGFHYALDAHPEIGNNAQIIKKLDGEIVDTLFDGWGFVSKLKTPKSLTLLQKESEELFEREILHFGESLDREVQTIGVVSGGAKPNPGVLHEMQMKGVELYISGETSESSPHKMIETGMNYFVCGHYATETFGVKELALRLEELLDSIEIKFINITNPI